MAALDEAHVEKKLLNLSNTQEAIQSLSLWAIHHKTHHEKLVDIWFRVLTKCAMSQRLTLFYLCNDIVQICKRKHAVMYKDAFREILKDAVLHVRDNTIRPNIERIFTIWEEREVYDAEFIEELVVILNNTKAKSTGNFRSLAEFQPQVLVDKIRHCRKQQESTELKRQQLQHLKLDVTSVESVKQIKDRLHSKEFMKQFEDSCTKLDDVVNLMEAVVKERQGLIEMLEQSELYYDTQYGEAKVVTNAYKIFGSRVNNLQKKLHDYRLTLPDDGTSPVPSPPPDAPSPGESPVPGEGGADDNSQAIDMEMSDEENEGESSKRKGGSSVASQHPMTTSRVKDVDVSEIKVSESGQAKTDKVLPSFRSELDPRRGGTGGVSSAGSNSSGASTTWDSKLAALRPKEKSGLESSTVLTRSSESVLLPGLEANAGGSTPVKDEHEGGGTPVQDEKMEGGSGGGSVMKNPIEFLSQLINQAPKSSTGVTSGILDNLFKIVGGGGLGSSLLQPKLPEEQSASSAHSLAAAGATTWSQPASFSEQQHFTQSVPYQQQAPQYAPAHSQSVPMPPPPPMPSFSAGLPSIPQPQLPPSQPFDQQNSTAYLPMTQGSSSAPSSYTPFYQTAAPMQFSVPVQPSASNAEVVLGRGGDMNDSHAPYMGNMDTMRNDFHRDAYGSGAVDPMSFQGNVQGGGGNFSQAPKHYQDDYEGGFVRDERFDEMDSGFYNPSNMSQRGRRSSYNTSNLRTLAGGELSQEGEGDMTSGNDDDDFAYQPYRGDAGQMPNQMARVRGPGPPFYSPRGGGPRFNGPMHSAGFQPRFEQQFGDERFERFGGPPPPKRPFLPPRMYNDSTPQFY